MYIHEAIKEAMEKDLGIRNKKAGIELSLKKPYDPDNSAGESVLHWGCGCLDSAPP